MKTIIFDIDGTLANISHRTHHIQGKNKNWKAFKQQHHLDTPIPAIVELFKALIWQADANTPAERFKYKIVCVSGRSEEEREVTEKWLKTHGLHPHEFHMRQSHDFRPDHVVKQEILTALKAAGHNILFAVDDRNQVVEMWRRNGITCLQCAAGDF